jgi:peptide-methionine (S)-S-oxide reductase
MRAAPNEIPAPERDVAPTGSPAPQTAVLAGGCFWCTEAVFKELDGVLEVTSGYVGDSAATADYGTVCSGGTNHAEAIRIRFDPAVISFGNLLKVFSGRARSDAARPAGQRRRSPVLLRDLPVDGEQRAVAEAYIRQPDRAGVFGARSRRLEPLGEFFEAEAYHQNYAARNPTSPTSPRSRSRRSRSSTHYRERLKS